MMTSARYLSREEHQVGTYMFRYHLKKISETYVTKVLVRYNRAGFGQSNRSVGRFDPPPEQVKDRIFMMVCLDPFGYDMLLSAERGRDR